MPQEIEVWYIIPGIRAEFAKSLSSKGLPQKQIAKMLGITEPAVCQYLKNKRASTLKFSHDIIEDINRSSDHLKNNSDFIKETQKICGKLMDSGFICKVHKEYNKDLPKDCNICQH